MASRQNRKKKGHANQQVRERTVTTLTEDPDTNLLVPTSSDEPAGGPMSSPFSVASSSGGGPNSSTSNSNNNNSVPNSSFQASNDFGYSGSYNNNRNSYMGPTQHGSGGHQHDYQATVSLPAGRNDLEILENLKAQIKAGQHGRFRPDPQPLALLAIHQEGLQAHAQQQGVGSYGTGYNRNGYDVGSAARDSGAKTASSGEESRRVPHIQTKDVSDISGPRRSVDSSPVSGLKAPIKVPFTSPWVLTAN